MQCQTPAQRPSRRILLHQLNVALCKHLFHLPWVYPFITLGMLALANILSAL